MKTIRKTSTNLLILTVITFSILFLSCSPNELDDETLDFSAEDIFKGVIFFEGKVAEAVPYINQNLSTKLSLSKHDRISYLEYQNEMIDYLKSEEPSFLVEFKNEILSKDIYRINKALKKAVGYNLEYIRTLIPDEIAGKKLNSLDFTRLKEQLDKEGVDGFKRQLKTQLNYNSNNKGLHISIVSVIQIVVAVEVYIQFEVVSEIYREFPLPITLKDNKDIISFSRQELLVSILENL